LSGAESIRGLGQFGADGGFGSGGELSFGLSELGLGFFAGLFGGIELSPSRGKFVPEGGDIGGGSRELGAKELNFGGGVGTAIEGFGLFQLLDLGAKGSEIAFANG